MSSQEQGLLLTGATLLGPARAFSDLSAGDLVQVIDGHSPSIVRHRGPSSQSQSHGWLRVRAVDRCGRWAVLAPWTP